MDAKSDIKLSVILPVYNEHDSLEPLYDEIVNALSGKYTYEIIFIDDGSNDGGFELLEQIQAKDPNVCLIRFRTNFGQTAAMAAGFEHARGDIVIPLDADGQNDPADIPALVQKLEEGYDIVSGWRRKRKDTFLTRTLPSRMANWVIGRITGVKLHDYGCSLKAYRAKSIKEIKLYGEMHRFIPALASWGGEKVTEMEVNHRPREKGITKYGMNRIVKVILDLITVKFLASFSTKPIYVFGGLGGLCFLGSFACAVEILYLKFFATPSLNVNRNPMLVVGMVLMMASIQFILMGLLAEILVRTYHESQGRSIYTIDRILRSDARDQGSPEQ